MIDDVGVLPDVQEATDWILVLTGRLIHSNEFVCLIPSHCWTVQGRQSMMIAPPLRTTIVNLLQVVLIYFPPWQMALHNQRIF